MAKYKLTISAEFESNLDIDELMELGQNVELPENLDVISLADFLTEVIEDDNSWALDQIDINETHIKVEVQDLTGLENYAERKKAQEGEDGEDGE